MQNNCGCIIEKKVPNQNTVTKAGYIFQQLPWYITKYTHLHTDDNCKHLIPPFHRCAKCVVDPFSNKKMLRRHHTREPVFFLPANVYKNTVLLLCDR